MLILLPVDIFGLLVENKRRIDRLFFSELSTILNIGTSPFSDRQNGTNMKIRLNN